MTARPAFHGSDIEKICEYYHLNKEDITNFGANVNPLGLSEKVKRAIAGHLDLLSSYPDREYTSLRQTISEYCHIQKYRNKIRMIKAPAARLRAAGVLCFIDFKR